MTAEAVAFWVLAVVAVAGAVGVVAAPKAVYSAIFLAATMICLAVLYVTQDALFLGVVQVVVYTGAVMMLFLFVLMLIGVDSSESLVETIRGQRLAALIAGVGFGILLVAGIGTLSSTGFAGLEQANAGGNVQGLAALIFTKYLWAFELTSALLITAALGAMVLAHRERFERRQDSAGTRRGSLSRVGSSHDMGEFGCVRPAQRSRHACPVAGRFGRRGLRQQHPGATQFTRVPDETEGGGR